jgi:hypothetical protein
VTMVVVSGNASTNVTQAPFTTCCFCNFL